MNKELLKKDLFGEIWKLGRRGEFEVLRDTRPARWWLAWLARVLLRREVRALTALTGVNGVPKLASTNHYSLTRSFLPGVPLYEGRPDRGQYFSDAARLLRRIHRAGVAHNDLAKEPNLLVCVDGSPAIIDFQLASHSRRRGRLFRTAAREDIRHLLKHKRTYRPDLLTARERSILDSPAFLSRAFMSIIKPVYLFVTRRLMGWSDREGAAER
ncbi:MAG: serine/threonine protein kinase [Woeseiaceae bacterium]|nr:serine/threonine protein kinase [Woeseiaceae bacterium]